MYAIYTKCNTQKRKDTSNEILSKIIYWYRIVFLQDTLKVQVDEWKEKNVEV